MNLNIRDFGAGEIDNGINNCNHCVKTKYMQINFTE